MYYNCAKSFQEKKTRVRSEECFDSFLDYFPKENVRNVSPLSDGVLLLREKSRLENQC